MKISLAFTLTIVFAIKIGYSQKQNASNSNLQDLEISYLNQKVPGMTPEVFAPGIVSTRDHKEFSCTFSPDGKEFYFNRNGHIMVCRYEENEWQLPVPASFDTDHMDHEPHISADGNSLFFGSNRDGYGIWMTEKNGDEWGEPVPLGSGMYVTSSNNGNIYMTSFAGEDGSLIQTKLEEGKFSEFISLKGGVNSLYDDWHPCIAPDESYILFDSNRPASHQGEGSFDLYVCFRMKDGVWSEAINIGEKLNIRAENICAYISPDGKYLFYNSMNGDTWDIYWVDAKIIEELKPRNLKYEDY